MNKNILVLLVNCHGKNTPGKRSPDGAFREYKWGREINKLITEKLYSLGIKTIIVNPEEEEVKLSVQAQRVNKLYNEYKNQYDEIILLSPHVNASSGNTWSNATGWVCYVYNKASKKSRKLATLLCEQAYDKYHFQGNRWIPQSRYFEANFAILRETVCPAVLTENFFQTNKKDVEFLSSEEGKNALADIHVDAVLQYIKE